MSHGWWDAFQRRHPRLSIRTAEGLGYARAIAFDRVVINRYYDMLEATLRDNGVWDLPEQVFNCDETGMPLNPNTSKVVATKGTEHPYQLTSETWHTSLSWHVQVLLGMQFHPWSSLIKGY